MMLGRSLDTYDSVASGANLDDGDVYDLAGLGGNVPRARKVEGAANQDIYDLGSSGSTKRLSSEWDESRYDVKPKPGDLERTGEYLDVDQVPGDYMPQKHADALMEDTYDLGGSGSVRRMVGERLERRQTMFERSDEPYDSSTMASIQGAMDGEEDA